MSFPSPWSPTTSSRIASATPAGSRTRSVVAAMPAPHWFFRFMYDRESAAWERRRDEPEHRELVERTADELANVVAPPGPVADLGCGPGAHALALARRGYDVVGVDGSPRMVEVARTRAARDEVDATFDVHDVERAAPLRGRVARRCPRDPRPTAPPASRGLHRRDPALPPAGRAPVDHRSRPREHVAHVPEPVLAAARSVLPPRARRRPLLRHELPPSSSRGPGPDRRRVQRRARSRERVGSRITSLVGSALQRRERDTVRHLEDTSERVWHVRRVAERPETSDLASSKRPGARSSS